MKSSRHNQSAKRSRWAHVNTPDGWRRRRAAMDARRESIAAALPPADAGPQPGEAWQTVLVLGAHGDVMHRISLYVPTSGRCDQHAADVDGQRILMTATQIGRSVAGMICKRPTLAQTTETRREQWRAACDIEATP